YLWAVLTFRDFLERPGSRQAWVWGLATGLALTVKFSALSLIPVYGVLAGLEKGWKPRLEAWPWRSLGIFLAACLMAVGVVYLPGTLFLSPHQLPWVYWVDGFRDLLSDPPNPVYFMGQLGTQSHWGYYPLALLLKTPLPLL